MSGFQTLFYKELLRFWKLSFQTVLAPVVTAIFLSDDLWPRAVGPRPGVSGRRLYELSRSRSRDDERAAERVPNSSSSLTQSKITGNLVFVLLPPIAHWEMFFAYVLASVVRGLCVGLCVFIVTIWFIPMSFSTPIYIIAFAVFGSAILGTLGLIAGIWADKFDQLMAFQNFLIMPLTFLSGVSCSTRRTRCRRCGARCRI